MKRVLVVVVTALMAFALLVAICGAAGTLEEAARLYKKGLELGVQGKFPQAKTAFNQALRVEPQLVPAQRCLELIAQIEAGTIKPETASTIFKATDYGAEGRLDQAIRELDRALKVEPRLADIYDLRGYLYYEKGNFDRAIADYDRALEINPRFAPALCNRGVAYALKGEFDRAIADYNRALEINPRVAFIYNNRGNAYKAKGDLDRAIADYDRALEINPKYPTAWFNKGQACEKAGRKAEAREAYQNFIRYAPLQQAAKIKHAQARIRALSSQAETPQATTSTPGVGAKKWGVVEMITWMKHNNAGADLMIAGQYRKALVHLNKAIEIAPSGYLSYKNRAEVYFKLKQYNKAWDDVKKAQSLKHGEVDPKFLKELRQASGREK